MAQNITIAGADFENVPGVELPRTGGGMALFPDTSDATATAGDIAAGKTAYADGVKLVGTGEGGSGKNVQVYHGMSYSRTASLVSCVTPVRLTIAKTGTYKISWVGYRNTSGGTSSSQLFIGGSAYGSPSSSFTSSYGQSVVLNNVQLTEGQSVEVRARARSASYYMYVGNLMIEEIT